MVHHAALTVASPFSTQTMKMSHRLSEYFLPFPMRCSYSSMLIVQHSAFGCANYEQIDSIHHSCTFYSHVSLVCMYSEQIRWGLSRCITIACIRVFSSLDLNNRKQNLHCVRNRFTTQQRGYSSSNGMCPLIEKMCSHWLCNVVERLMHIHIPICIQHIHIAFLHQPTRAIPMSRCLLCFIFYFSCLAVHSN